MSIYEFVYLIRLLHEALVVNLVVSLGRSHRITLASYLNGNDGH